MRRIYIAGPMRGRPENNVPAFNQAAERFRALGWHVENPVELSAELCKIDPDTPPGAFLRMDARAISTCDAIALLPEWEHSTGARCEVALGIKIGLEFFEASSGVRMPTPEIVTIRGGYDRPAGPVDTLETLAREATAWANATFQQATNQSRANHLVREAVELQKDPEDLEECADVFMLLCHIVQDPQRLVDAVRAKLEKNKRRVWGVADAEGVVEHLEVADA